MKNFQGNGNLVKKNDYVQRYINIVRKIKWGIISV